MNICRFNGGRIGLVHGAALRDMTDAMAGKPEAVDAALFLAAMPATELAAMQALAPQLAIADVSLESPIRAPGKVVAAPVNYKAHVEEMQRNGQAHGHILTDIRQAGLFLKASSSVTGPSGGIAQRFLNRRTDHEIELCAVIGKTASAVAVSDALDCVAGYCLGLDITVRGTEDRSFRKSIDTYCVLGPWMVTADEAGDPDLIDLELQVNGEVRQHANTSDMVMSVAELIAYASSFYTLYPGDVLMTGTPQGVGPIRPGDTLHASGSGLGTMDVRVRAVH
jgi:2-keto-4-pentenoate hydratase/2-oxohepta-3-ene-1,7-dioic acid hydratase in catechol pathway